MSGLAIIKNSILKQSISTKLLNSFKMLFKAENNNKFEEVYLTEQKAFYPYLPFSKDYDYKNLTFTFSFIALAAKLLNIDGPINELEINTYVNIFPVTNNHHDKLVKLLKNANNEEVEWQNYIYKIMFLFPNQMSLYKDLINNLISLALSDNKLTNSELNLLEKVVNLLGYSKDQLISMIRAKILDDIVNQDKLHLIFGLNESYTTAQLTDSYRSLAKSYHPDNFSKYHDIATDYIDIMNDYFLIVNQAYKKLKR